MSQHNYTNPAFCQNSEFYQVPSNDQHPSSDVESIYNRSLNLNFETSSSACRNPRDGPLRLQRSMSTRSFVAQSSSATTRRVVLPPKRQQSQQRTQYHDSTLPVRFASTQQRAAIKLNRAADAFETRSNSGRYALVPVEELSGTSNQRYAIVPGPPLATAKRYAKSQDNLDRYDTHDRLPSEEEPHSFHEDPSVTAAHQFASLPPVFDESPQKLRVPVPPPKQHAKIKHAFSSDFGSKSFLIVDKNSNQRYQMVPTAEDEELVDDNQEIIQMHNGRAHRYAVIPTEDAEEDDDGDGEEETCLSTSDLNQSHNYLALNYESTRTPLRTSTPQKGVSMANLGSSYTNTPNPSYPNTPLKNPAATKMLHELLSTPRKLPVPRSAQTTPRNVVSRPREEQREPRHTPQYLHHQSQQQIYYAPVERKKELSPQRLHYDTVKSSLVAVQHADRTMAVISPRVAGSKAYPELEDCSDIHGKSLNNSSYPQKVANATVTLAVVSLMLVLGSTMNSGLIIYMIAHLGKSFYLQFSLVAAFCGVGLGFLGFRARHCEWLPNRSYTSGYILVTMFCLLKCCGLLVILVLDPYPGLPLHDVTTGVILGLSTFTIFFIGLGVIGSLWCYRPPPDNRVNVV